MFLKNLVIKNFRNISNLSIDFRKGLNIFVGENNAGKSAIIDALRICFNYGKQMRDICVKRSDFHINLHDPDAVIIPIEFDLLFEIEASVESCEFIDLLSQSEDGTHQSLQIHYKYYLEDKNELEKIRYTVWGGDNEGQEITSNVLNLLLFLYLESLGDEVQQLWQFRGNRLDEFFSYLCEDIHGDPITDEKRDELAQRLRESLTEDSDWNSNIETGKQKINEHFEENSITSKKQQSEEIDFSSFEFNNIVDNLRTILLIFDSDLLDGDNNKQRYFDIESGGLGYDKLVYLEKVLSDFKNRKNLDLESYIALLIEEPEIQLHSQLQSIYLNYLSMLDSIGFQIFINSSHSPTVEVKNSDKYTIIEEILDEYINILSLSIISEYINNNEEFKTKIFLEIILGNKSDSLTTAVKNFIMPKQLVNLDSVGAFQESLHNLYEETTLNHFKSLSVSIEKSFLRNQGFPRNKKLSKEEADEILLRIKKFNIQELESELSKYDPEMLLFAFYGIADRLALLSGMTVVKVNNDPIVNNSLIEDNPFSILANLISNIDKKGLLQTSLLIGTEKQLNDILFNFIYKIYRNNNKKEDEKYYESEVNIRRIYQLTYMVSTSNLYLESNQLLYEQGEALVIRDYTLLQSGDFNEKMLCTQTDIVESDYREDIVKKVFEEYSKREGFCPDDLFEFAKISAKGRKAQIHLLTFDREKLKKNIIESTNVKEYGIDRFIDVLTLQKEIREIAHSTNKLSMRPFLELNDGTILYSTNLLLQAFLVLESRMLQQSFTTNKKLQRFISKNYDEVGIADLVQVLTDAKYPYLEHVSLDKISNKHIKDALSIKGITKEFDLIFIKNKTLFVVEYKTWKISSYNIIQVLKEQKKITKNIENHLKAIDIISSHPTEFKKLFGDKFNYFTNIELIMVFQNPTTSKYIVNQKNVKVMSTKQFNEFII